MKYRNRQEGLKQRREEFDSLSGQKTGRRRPGSFNKGGKNRKRR